MIAPAFLPAVSKTGYFWPIWLSNMRKSVTSKNLPWQQPYSLYRFAEFYAQRDAPPCNGGQGNPHGQKVKAPGNEPGAFTSSI